MSNKFTLKKRSENNIKSKIVDGQLSSLIFKCPYLSNHMIYVILWQSN